MKHNKPNSQDINTVWGESATVDNLERPSDSYIHDGWLQVKPPYQIENWSMNKLHSFIAYINQRGIPEWDNETEYFINSSYVMGGDGRVYKCIQTNVSRNPTTNGNSQYWELTSWDRYATTSKAGIVRKATPEQVLAGNDNETYVTPATYKRSLPDIPTPPDATQGNRGMIELATQNETDRGDDDIRAVTPQKLRGYRDNVILPIASPTGSVEAYAGSSAPDGWLECDGREYSRSSYSALFTVIGTRFGNGNGSSSFNVPDLRGEFIRGWDNGRGVDRNRVLGSHQGDAFRTHKHSGSTSSEGRHNHDFKTSTEGSHNHPNSHTWNGGGHSHSGSTNTTGNHSHSGSTNTAGNHYHNMRWDYAGNEGGRDAVSNSDDPKRSDVTRGSMEYAGNHSHSLSTNTTGNHSHSLNIDSVGDHRHDLNIVTDGSHSHSGYTATTGEHSHSFTTSSIDQGDGSETRPRNTALMYIIKT